LNIYFIFENLCVILSHPNIGEEEKAEEDKKVKIEMRRGGCMKVAQAWSME